jgi:hypothetical protein
MINVPAAVELVCGFNVSSPLLTLHRGKLFSNLLSALHILYARKLKK